MITINPNKTIFVNIDTQFDFMDPEGKLYVPQAEAINPILEEITQFAKDNQIQVINTQDWHYPDSEELSEDPDFSETFPPHCLADTKGASFIAATQPHNPYIIDWGINMDLKKLPPHRNLILRKDKFNVFDGNPNTIKIFEILQNQGITEVIIYGVSGDICVAQAITGLLEFGFQVTLLLNATQSLNETALENSIKVWEEQGLIVTNWKDISLI